MKIFSLIFLLSFTTLAQRYNGQFKGYANLSYEISHKIFQKHGDFEINYLLSNYNSIKSLFGQMGGYGSAHQFKNGSVNSVGLFMHYYVLSSLNKRLSLICSRSSAIPFRTKKYGRKAVVKKISLNENFLLMTKELCQWPKLTQSQLKQYINSLWMYLNDYLENPSAVSNSAQFFFKNYQTKDNKTLLSDILTSIMLHPEFLLNR